MGKPHLMPFTAYGANLADVNCDVTEDTAITFIFQSVSHSQLHTRKPAQTRDSNYDQIIILNLGLTMRHVELIGDIQNSMDKSLS